MGRAKKKTPKKSFSAVCHRIIDSSPRVEPEEGVSFRTKRRRRGCNAAWLGRDRPCSSPPQPGPPPCPVDPLSNSTWLYSAEGKIRACAILTAKWIDLRLFSSSYLSTASNLPSTLSEDTFSLRFCCCAEGRRRWTAPRQTLLRSYCWQTFPILTSPQLPREQSPDGNFLPTSLVYTMKFGTTSLYNAWQAMNGIYHEFTFIQQNLLSGTLKSFLNCSTYLCWPIVVSVYIVSWRLWSKKGRSSSSSSFFWNLNNLIWSSVNLEIEPKNIENIQRS